MGLDWVAQTKAKPGKEAEFTKIVNELIARASSGRGIEDLFSPMAEISVAAYASLGAPRVGIDAEATELMRKLLTGSAEVKNFEDWVIENRGYYVLELLPPCDGIPKYSNGGMYDGIDRTSFRGSFLQDCAHIIGKDLWEEAFSIMLPEKLLTYADKLDRKAVSYARFKKLDLSRIDFSKDSSEGDIFNLEVVLSAACYCRFWGERGFYMAPWY